MAGHHQHDNPFAQRCCDLRDVIAKETGCASAVIILEERGDLNVPHYAWNGNMTHLATMVRVMLESASAQERPTDCDHCAHNWDLMRQAHAIMTHSRGSC